MKVEAPHMSDDDFQTYRRLILEELTRLNKECENNEERFRKHELSDKDSIKQIALDIQALQIAAKNAGYKAGKEAGLTWGTGSAGIISTALYVITWVLQNKGY